MTREEEIYKSTQKFVGEYLDGLYDAETLASKCAKWADEHPRKGLVDIDKACEWLEKNACNYEYSGGTCDSWFSASDLVDNLRKYMEEQQ